MSGLARLVNKVGGLHKAMAESHPDLVAGRVKCQTCGRTLRVDSAECLREGWPKCCGYTMSLERSRR